jgi:hypothetical protein
MPNQFEKGPERIPNKEEVLEIINRRVESPEKFETLRELHDEQGLTLLDLRIEGKEAGETSEYLYTRKGLLPNGVPTAETSIEVSYYQDGQPIGGDRIAIFNYEKNDWEL